MTYAPSTSNQTSNGNPYLQFSGYVTVNIVEGSAKKGPAEFRRFLDISLGSLSELSYLLQVSRELGYLNATEWAELDQLGNRARFLTWRLCQAVGRARLRTPK